MPPRRDTHMALPFLRHSGTLPRLCGLLVILATGALFALVGCFALPVLWSAQGSLIFSWTWRPPADFGILPMLAGSLILSFSALLLAWPLSLGLACALQDPAPAFWQKWLTGLIRFMTAIPTVVYGFAAVFLLTPLVREAAGQGSGLCWLSAACVLALLISPTMVLVMDVALREQMRRLLLPALSLGMSRDTVLACLALPAVRRWLLTAGLLGFGRAIGDTLIPLMLSGNAPNVPHNLFAGLRTLTAHMGLVTATDVGGPAYNSLFVAGGLLLCISTGVSLVLRRLEKKYSTDEEGLAALLADSERRLDELEYAGDRLAQLEKETAKAYALAEKKACALTDIRQAAAKRLEERVVGELRDLSMPSVRFEVRLLSREGKNALSASGADEVSFVMSANAGEALGPISRIASGGELSRIMLALKNVFAEKDGVDALIFDEIDTGVSGVAAQRVAEKLASLGRTKQVLCVTHLPQIAAMAQQQYLVEKAEHGGRTYTNIRLLDREGRRYELARLSGGDMITDIQLAGAEELLARDERFRASLS